MDRFDVAAAFREIAALLKVTRGNRYRARAYRNAADALEELEDDLATVIREGRLRSIRGIGDKLAAQIEEMVETGRAGALEKLRAQVPAGMLDTLEETRPAILLADAMDLEKRLVRWLAASRAVRAVEPSGALRRRLETVEAIELLIAADDIEAALDRFVKFPRARRTVSRDAGGAELLLPEGARARAAVVAPDAFPLELAHRTGPPGFHAALVARARRRRLVLKPDRLTRARRRVPIAREEDLYAELGLAWVPPETRTGAAEVREAARGTFDDLVTADAITGFVHCHTEYSDGVATVRDMAREAKRRGKSFITITDHSPTAHYAGGVELDRLKRQWDEIAAAEEEVGITILRGTESDILKDGALDYPDRVLAQMDIVIASIHNRYKLDREQMTRRLVRAMRHPFFKVWGHGLGRLLLRRPPIECDVEKVLDALAESRGAVEINGDPHRLDLEPRWVRAARERGIRFVLSTDAHAPGQLDYLRYSVLMARRAGLRAGDVLNTLPVDAFRDAVRPAGPARARRAA